MDTSTCDRLVAEARAEAITLYSPRLAIEAARAPSVIDAIDAVPLGHGLQGRVALAMSGVDVLRGRKVEQLAAAECTRTRAAERAGDVLALGLRVGEREAVRAELAYREAHLAQVEAFVREGLERLDAQRGTAQEVGELRHRRTAMNLRIAELRHALAALDELAPPATLGDLAALARELRSAEVAVARRRAELRGLAAWRLDVRGGVAAGEQADWFAVVDVSYALGQPLQRRANRRALAAATREVAAPRALASELEQLVRVLGRSARELASELEMLDAELAAARADRDRVATPTSDVARHLHARFTLEVIELEARRAYASALLAARRGAVEAAS